MNIAQIENNLQQLVKSFKKEAFIYDLLLAYGQPKASITRLQQGGLNLSRTAGEIAWKKKLFFKAVQEEDLHELIDDIKADDKAIKHNPRFIVVTDFETLLAIDRKTLDTLDIPILEIPKYFDFFLPWAGMEKAQHQYENPADVKAAERMGKLYDEIKKDNSTKTHEEAHNLNVFLSRLLFCFFAEDTGIFDKGQFTNGMSSHTQQDGSDLHTYLDKLFDVMNTEPSKRNNLPAYLEAFPYVNGGLYKNKHHAPIFTRRSRQAIIDSGELDWSTINPDIFGSMFQAVISPEQRGGWGMHYTSVPNIMKVIEPLFLNELYEEFEVSKGNNKKLNALIQRIQNIKIFDPACGSGNFLIIAYKEFRRLEMKIFKAMNSLAFSNISLSNFYGIELDDFAHEAAILSLWLAEHQMNQEFFKEFGRTKPALPLKETGNIVHGNATRIDWEQVCPKDENNEIYVMGNPPYVGFKMQSPEQKKDMDLIFDGIEDYKSLDYISCWFYKACLFMNDNVRVAFVTTNSICQGSQVPMLWPHLFPFDIEIFFAYTSFQWSNNAKNNAGVSVSIIGLRKNSPKPKYLFVENLKKMASNINAYLIDYPNIIISKRKTVLSNLPKISDGSGALDGGNLVLSDIEKNEITKNYPDSTKYIRQLMGSEELINNIIRWCLWIEDEDLQNARTIQPIRERIDAVKKVRLNGGTRGKTCLNTPHRFAWINQPKNAQIIIPTVSSERREYIPISYIDKEIVVINSASIIHDPAPYVFGIITSKIHNVWVKTIAGKLENRIRYTSAVCYNTFPFPSISQSQIQEIERNVYQIIEEREKHSEKTLAQLYDPDKMPVDLREAHHQNDLAVERCYRSKPFESDEERLEYLFKLYEQMIAEEREKGTLFEAETKTKKKRK